MNATFLSESPSYYVKPFLPNSLIGVEGIAASVIPWAARIGLRGLLPQG